MNWNHLTSIEQIEEIIQESHRVPCLVFKHSTRCNISSIAKFRLEDDWSFTPEAIQPFYLDLLNHRDISTKLSEVFHVYHESPQILFIKNGECTFDASHLDISVEEIGLVMMNDK
jgi:bacillithiol system protein YtxJ